MLAPNGTRHYWVNLDRIINFVIALASPLSHGSVSNLVFELFPIKNLNLAPDYVWVWSDLVRLLGLLCLGLIRTTDS